MATRKRSVRRGDRNYLLLDKYKHRQTPLEKDLQSGVFGNFKEGTPEEKIVTQQRSTISGMFKSVLGLSSVLVGAATGMAVGVFATTRSR